MARRRKAWPLRHLIPDNPTVDGAKEQEAANEHETKPHYRDALLSYWSNGARRIAHVAGPSDSRHQL
jgi:hypothetical protein